MKHRHRAKANVSLFGLFPRKGVGLWLRDFCKCGASRETEFACDGEKIVTRTKWFFEVK